MKARTVVFACGAAVALASALQIVLLVVGFAAFRPSAVTTG